MIKILSWNILHGGGKRANDILDAINKEQPDIVTLQEFRHGSSKDVLLKGLAEMGLDEQFVPGTNSARDNSLIIASRYNFQAQIFPKGGDIPARAIRAFFPDLAELNLIAAHLPQKKKQPPYLHGLIDLDKVFLKENSLIIGDLNCGIPFEDSETKSFEHTFLFQQLLRDGWVDAWRSRNKNKREYTWISTKQKNGFRYDHALASVELDNKIKAINYNHNVRLNGISDHSLITVAIDL
ncbi:MAG: endonuclease/exonuclease/phosphatase family protein [Cocleimonas sp.]